MGPTCSGKTALAIEMAKRHPVSLINVDSAQVYRGLNIGSAKPDTETLKAFPHALLDICDPATPYNASDFCRDAKVEIESSFKAGKTPVLVGGTMMYFKALQNGLSPLPESTPDVRAHIATQADTLGWPAMHEKLVSLDPELAAKVKPNDAQRIGRALEVYEITGKSLSQLQQRAGDKLDYPIKAIALYPQDRAKLHQHIAERFDAMLDQGFLD